MSENEVAIYVLPADESGAQPPRAVVGQPLGDGMLAGVEVVWSRDVGTWMLGGTPVDPGLAEAITEHAKELGVSW